MEKNSITFLMPKQNELRDSTIRPYSTVTALFYIIKDSSYFLPYRLTNVIIYCY